MLDVDLGLAAHKLKSPLVSIKSLAFILKKEINKKDKKIIRRVTEIENKTGILNKRINQFILFLEYERGEADFLYELFDISQVLIPLRKKSKSLKLKEIKQEVVADRGKIEFALLSFLESFGKIEKASFTKKNKRIEFKVIGEVNAETLDTKKIFDENNDKALNLYISKKIIELHGGKVKIDKDLITITIPLRPASKK